MTPRIRPAEVDDAAAARDLAEAAYAPYVPRIGRRPAPMDADYADAFARPGNWVVEDAGRLVVDR